MPRDKGTPAEHIFISFSSSDKEMTEKLVEYLQEQGIPVWTDFRNLAPGTPDWESAIREAIDNSFALLLLASPDSRKSVYVKGEVSVAEARGCPVYPLWIKGQDWADCIPLGMTTTQYVDLRGKHYKRGIDQIVGTLRELIAASIPKHYRVAPLRRSVKVGKERRTRSIKIPPGCICIELDEQAARSWEPGGTGVIIKSADYSSVQQLLDDLYTAYLGDRFAPYTYGSSWVLANCGLYSNLVVVPWSWLLCDDKTGYRPERDWGLNSSPEQCGLRAQTNWVLTTDFAEPHTGLAVNDPRILYTIQRNPKAEYFLTMEGYLKYVSVRDVDPSAFQHLFVLHGGRRFLRLREDLPKGCVLVQTDKRLPERELRY